MFARELRVHSHDLLYLTMNFILRRISRRQVWQIQAGGCNEPTVECSVSSFADDDTAARDTRHSPESVCDATSGIWKC